MKCVVCGDSWFRPSTYTSGTRSVHAAECLECKNLQLDESLGETSDEKVLIRDLLVARVGVVQVERMRLLVVDDDPSIGRALARLLDDHDVTVITSAKAALILCAKRFFDAILCDVVMPEMTGPDFVAQLDAHAAARVIFVSGCGYDPRLTGHPVVTKPFELSTLERELALFRAPSF